MQNAELENAELPLTLGEVAPKVTERGFEEIEVAGAKRVTERVYKKISPNKNTIKYDKNNRKFSKFFSKFFKKSVDKINLVWYNILVMKI